MVYTTAEMMGEDTEGMVAIGMVDQDDTDQGEQVRKHSALIVF